ncbi:MAG: Fe-S cluster assembly protein SufB, partial [Candidatus Yonathbacteria bacterium RIFOXYC1_FULL_52_10]
MWKAQKSAKNEGNPGIHTGLSLDLVRHISKIKNEPEWMLEKRIAAYELYMNAPMPKWGPDLSGLDLENMVYFVDPGVAETDRWDELPPEITETFEKLGIPKAEREYLGGVGAQYDSGVVYHRLKQSLADKGVVFENMDVALQKYPELVQKYFMTDCVPAKDHKFTMLHGAVWSGGTFIYVPKGVKVDMPLQAYFRMNREASGQFEHTLIIADEGSQIEYIEGCSAPKYNFSSLHAGCVEIFVHQDAKAKYVSIENWSLNTYNLNTKRAIVYANAEMKWVNGNMGSGVTMLYPSSVLVGEGARADNLGLVIAGK